MLIYAVGECVAIHFSVQTENEHNSVISEKSISSSVFSKDVNDPHRRGAYRQKGQVQEARRFF